MLEEALLPANIVQFIKNTASCHFLRRNERLLLCATRVL